jgi:UDPglucose 6-dehydrogenase
VDALNARQSPIIDVELSEYLAEKDLNLSASTDLQGSLTGADYVIVSTPTNYDEKTNFFDTSSVEEVIAKVIESEANVCIVVKSTIPVGFIEDVRERLDTNAVIFSPEFLREGKALHDNLYPSRIIVGEKSRRAEIFAGLLAASALKSDVEILFTGSREAEAIKLFSNTYLAMRVAFFNELDSYALAGEMNSREIINGVSFDPRIGYQYNNPSFGYGGYCLPKDTKQLLASYNDVPQNMMSAIVQSNATRKQLIAEDIIRKAEGTLGIYRLTMKSNSDNFRHSPTVELMTCFIEAGLNVIIYEPLVSDELFMGVRVCNNLGRFKSDCNIIVANRISKDLNDVMHKVYSRDVFRVD